MLRKGFGGQGKGDKFFELASTLKAKNRFQSICTVVFEEQKSCLERQNAFEGVRGNAAGCRNEGCRQPLFAQYILSQSSLFWDRNALLNVHSQKQLIRYVRIRAVNACPSTRHRLNMLQEHSGKRKCIGGSRKGVDASIMGY